MGWGGWGGGSKGKAWEDGGTRGMEREEREERVVVVQRCELCMVVYVECKGRESTLHSFIVLVLLYFADQPPGSIEAQSAV